MRNRFTSIICVAATLVALAGPAAATTTYFGNSLGKSCFDAVRLGADGRKDLDLCSQAVNSGTLSNTDLPATLVNRGIILMRMERFKEAIEDYEAALRLDPELAEAKINMGAALIGLRRYASAINLLEEGLTSEPRAPHIAYYNLGIAHEMIGDYQGAREHYANAVTAAPEWSPAVRKLNSLPAPNLLQGTRDGRS